ncbi:unnamed protein product, partial [Cuscuta europaea]
MRRKVAPWPGSKRCSNSIIGSAKKGGHAKGTVQGNLRAGLQEGGAITIREPIWKRMEVGAMEERKKRDAEEAKKRKWESHGPQGPNKKGNHGGGRSFRAPAAPSKGNPATSGHYSGSQAPTTPRCRNCNGNHIGKCRDPPRCYQCGSTGHIKPNCPQLG